MYTWQFFEGQKNGGAAVHGGEFLSNLSLRGKAIIAESSLEIIKRVAFLTGVKD